MVVETKATEVVSGTKPQVIDRGEWALDCNETIAGRHPKALVIILLLGTVVRLGVWIWLGAHQPAHDERDYNALAENLVEHQQFAIRPDVPTSLRPPLYPFFVATVYQLFGVENWAAVYALQGLLSLVTVWIVYQLGSAAYSEQVGCWAAALTCFYPSLLVYNSLLLSEVLFIFLLCLTLSLIARGLRQNSLLVWAVVGATLGLAALTRSVLWLFPPVLAVYMLTLAPGTLFRRCSAAALMIVGFTLTIAPWSIRNSLLQRTLITIDVMGGRNLMMGNYEYTPLYRAWDAISMQGDEAWNEVLRPERIAMQAKTQGQIDKLAMRYGLHFMLSHPGLTLERSLIKFVNFWQLERELVAGARQGELGAISYAGLLLLALLIAGSYAAAAITGIFGAVLCPPGNWRIHVIFLLLVAFVCALHTLTFGHSRYHLPLIPIVLIYSAAAITHTAGIWSQRLSGRFALAVTLCTLLALSWGWEIFWVDPQRYFGALS